mmetsp:Transcript_21240/g.60632  ORF Transcript_21240/g.60632 Transcript_21240/m.60632 type:complete len:85 (-) Transcript_21240:132-386(-)
MHGVDRETKDTIASRNQAAAEQLTREPSNSFLHQRYESSMATPRYARSDAYAPTYQRRSTNCKLKATNSMASPFPTWWMHLHTL